MARDWLGDRFSRKRKKDKLDDLARKARPIEDLEDEEEMIEKADKVEPIKSEETVGRNDPCPCGSGKKYKKCCGKE